MSLLYCVLIVTFMCETGAVDYADQASHFSYGYDVKEYNRKDKTLIEHSRQEAGTPQQLTGEYRVLLPDGRLQVVRYTSGVEGYKPVISYEQVQQPNIPLKSSQQVKTDVWSHRPNDVHWASQLDQSDDSQLYEDVDYQSEPVVLPTRRYDVQLTTQRTFQPVTEKYGFTWHFGQTEATKLYDDDVEYHTEAATWPARRYDAKSTKKVGNKFNFQFDQSDEEVEYPPEPVATRSSVKSTKKVGKKFNFQRADSEEEVEYPTEPVATRSSVKSAKKSEKSESQEADDVVYIRPFRYKYDVDELSSKDLSEIRHSKTEVSDGKEITGEYSTLLDGGIIQRVKYTAGVQGFHADITYDQVDVAPQVEEAKPSRQVERAKSVKVEEPAVKMSPLKMKNNVFFKRK